MPYYFPCRVIQADTAQEAREVYEDTASEAARSIEEIDDKMAMTIQQLELAAPDLLSALVDLCSIMELEDIQRHGVPSENVRRAKAVIAKATR